MEASKKTVLVVDDDPDIQALFRIHLEAAGYRVLLAADGISCVAQARREQPDLVILDLGLPAGDGVSALRNLRGMESLRETRVLIVSAREAAAWSEMLRDTGADDYFQKPVDPLALVARVRALIGDGRVGARIQALPDASSAAEETVDAPPLSCPHCGGHLDGLSLSLDRKSIAALAAALRRAG